HTRASRPTGGRDRVAGIFAAGVVARVHRTFVMRDSTRRAVLELDDGDVRRVGLGVRQGRVADRIFGFFDLFRHAATAFRGEDRRAPFGGRTGPDGIRFFADTYRLEAFPFFRAFGFTREFFGTRFGVEDLQVILELQGRAGAFLADDSRDFF